MISLGAAIAVAFVPATQGSAQAFDLASKIQEFLQNPDSDLEGQLRNDSEGSSAPAPESDYLSVKDTSILTNHWKNMDQIEVEKPSSSSKYDRSMFEHWELIGTEQTKNDWPDFVPRSCDARRATLIRDGHNLEVKTKGCKIHVQDGGGWTDPYGRVVNGKIEYVSDTKPNGFDIDHIVSLGDVWRSGASEWDDAKRQMIANDPLNLSLSIASENRSKSDDSPSDYLPAGGFRCEYVKRYAAVKAKYDLSTTQADIDVLAGEGKKCGF